jgi:hypothetical protein
VKEKGMTGSAWVEVFFFLRRNPMIESRKAQKLNRFIVNDYFAKLKITVEELGIMNERVHL